MPADFQREHVPLTRGEAFLWARRFRKIGFSPVRVQQNDKGDYFLRCSYPYDLTRLPDDLRDLFWFGGDYYQERHIGTRFFAMVEYSKFHGLRPGTGSKPIRPPKQRQDPVGYESRFVPATRIAYDRDDWPGTQRHPDWERFMREPRTHHTNPPSSNYGSSAKGQNTSARFPCPCCGYFTLSEQPPGTFKICPVCFWEDGAVEYYDPDYKGGANGDTSLNEARRNFAAVGYADELGKEHVRPPRPEEFPPP